MLDPLTAIKGTTSLVSSLSDMSSPSTAQINKAAETAAPGATFADYLSNVSNTFVDNIKSAETTSVDGIMGKASVREVVESVMSAEQTLQTATAFRDKLVSAYLDIVKMPI